MTGISRNVSSPSKRFRLQGYGMMTLCMLGFLIWSISLVFPQRALDTSGHKTMGILTNFDVGSHGVLFVTYRYQVDNQTFTNRSNVRADGFRSEQIGRPVTVTYLPDRPTVSRTEPSNEAFSAYFGLWVAGGGSLVFLFLLVAEIINVRAVSNRARRR
jgi:hypothetical protein